MVLSCTLILFILKRGQLCGKLRPDFTNLNLNNSMIVKEMFKTIKKINFYDCDPAGILFFARVYEICHSAYEDLIRSFQLHEDYWNNADYVVPIINSEAHYHKPIKYGESIFIELVVSKLKTSSFELEYRLKNEAGETCTVVRTVHVFVDKSTWGKKQIKLDVKAGLEKYYLDKAGEI